MCLHPAVALPQTRTRSPHLPGLQLLPTGHELTHTPPVLHLPLLCCCCVNTHTALTMNAEQGSP